MMEKLSEEEVLFRQIHPSFIHDGVPSSQSFTPTPKDEGKLSLDRSKLTDPDISFERFLQSGQQSAAVYGVSTAEFYEQAIECFSDPIDDADLKLSNPAHAYANYASFSGNFLKNKAKLIKQKALARGCLHPKGI
jgi:hypothetical protein